MTRKREKAEHAQAERWYRGKDVPQATIRRFAREVAERFKPEKIILFGSHAYGTPHDDSDVDILVVMPCRNELDQAVKISVAVDRQFPLDLIVRKPRDLRRRLEDGDLFHTQIVTQGKVLYENGDARMDRKGGKRLSTSRANGRLR